MEIGTKETTQDRFSDVLRRLSLSVPQDELACFRPLSSVDHDKYLNLKRKVTTNLPRIGQRKEHVAVRRKDHQLNT